MPTWVLTAVGLPVSAAADSNLDAQIPLTGTQPADWNENGITEIRLARTLSVSGLSDDSITDHMSMAVYNNASQGWGADTTGDVARSADGSWGFGPRSISSSATKPTATGNYALGSQVGTPWATYNANMKADGGVISITALTVEIDYTPLAPPVASFTADQTTIVAGQNIELLDASTNSPSSWLWSITPGTKDVDWGVAAPPTDLTLQNFTSAARMYFWTAGSYDVTLQVTNAAGSDVSGATTITVNPDPGQAPPVVVASVEPTINALFAPGDKGSEFHFIVPAVAEAGDVLVIFGVSNGANPSITIDGGLTWTSDTTTFPDSIFAWSELADDPGTPTITTEYRSPDTDPDYTEYMVMVVLRNVFEVPHGTPVLDISLDADSDITTTRQALIFAGRSQDFTHNVSGTETSYGPVDGVYLRTVADTTEDGGFYTISPLGPGESTVVFAVAGFPAPVALSPEIRRGAVVYGDGSPSMNVPVPANATGEVSFVFGSFPSGFGVSTPAGWTVATQEQSQAGAASMTMRIWRRVWQPGDPATVSWDTASSIAVLMPIAVVGLDTTTPVALDGTVFEAMTVPSMNATDASQIVLAATGGRVQTSETVGVFSATNGLTDIWSEIHPNRTVTCGFGNLYADQLSATGATGEYTFSTTTPTGLTWAALGVLLNVDPAYTGPLILPSAPPPSGSASGSWTVVGSASGTAPAVATNSGAASGAWSFSGTASGTAPAVATNSGTASGAWLVSGTAFGSKASRGSSSGSWGVSGTATGTAPGVPPSTGTAVGSWTASGSVAGSSPNAGSTSGTWDAAGSATGTAPVVGANSGSASGQWGVAGTASGSKSPGGSASGSWLYTGTAGGVAPVVGAKSGSASGSWTTTGTATGSTPAVVMHSGSSSGSWFSTGTANGTTPVVGANSGSASTSWTTTGTSSGSRTSKGSVSAATWTVSGTVNGSAPIPGSKSGSASGSWGVIGTVSGSTAHSGWTGGAWTLIGSASGSILLDGSASGSWTTVGSVSGVAPLVPFYSGNAVGAWQFIGSATGPLPPSVPTYVWNGVEAVAAEVFVWNGERAVAAALEVRA